MADNVTLYAENCRLFLKFVLRECNGTYTLPKGAVDELNYSFKMGDETLRIATTGCYFRDWGVTLDYDTDITYVDTEITIGMNAGTNPEEKAKLIEITGLKAQRYDDFIVDYDTNHVHLVNTKISSWYPQAFNGVTVDIDDSDLADVQWNSNNSTVIVRNSKVAIAVSKENVTYRFINCVINGDITAKENSTIYLEDTTVKGKITTYDNGRVIVDGDPYTG